MKKKTIEPQDDAVEEIEETAKEQTEHEFSTSDLMLAAERCKADRYLDFIRILNRPKVIGTESFPLNDDAVAAINRTVVAGARHLQRVFESDLPREITSWD